MDLDALRDADFSLLDDAVSDWSTMVGDLETLKEDAEKGLRGAANKANWAGYNATVTKEFIGKTSGEFADAHTQAHSIHKVLQDTRDELKAYKRQLHEVIERAGKKNLTIIGGKGSFTVTATTRPDWASDPSGKTDAGDQAAVDQFRDEIQRILDKATESDSTASSVLVAIADQSELGFSDANYNNRDTAADALKKADELARLAKKDPDELTVKEFDTLTAGLKKYGNDGLFAERFATDLGPKKTLEFWSGITDQRNDDIFSNRRDQLDDLQRGLSLTLASASQSDSAAMADWKHNAIDLGATRLGNNGTGPTGFQVMSNLMRVGDYDDRFMVDYGTRLMAEEKAITGYGQQPNAPWHLNDAFQTVEGAGIDQYLNYIGNDSGADPLTGYLRGLSNSPDAATEFFNQEYVSKDNPDNPFERGDDDKKNKVSLSNFQYLFEERDWPHERGADGEVVHVGQNNLAMALEAATTGHPAGEMPTLDTPAHDAEQAKLMRSLVTSISEDNERLTKHGYMGDSIGQIASEYLPDINRSMTDDADNDTDRLFPIAGSEATFEHRDVTRFLFTVGQNTEGYAAVEVGQKAYMANLMEYHLNPDLPKDQRYAQDPQFVVEEIARGSGEVSGTLAQGRAEFVAGKADEVDQAYEHSVAQRKNAISGLVGTVTGVGATLIASPAGGAAASGIAGTATSMILEEVFKDAEGKAKGDAGAVMGEHWESGLDSNSGYTERAAETAAKNHGRADLPDVGEWARVAAQRGFGDSGTNVTTMAPDLKTDI